MENDSNTMDQCEQNSPSNSSNKNSDPLTPSYGRYCHIVKRPDFDGYGFNLHSEKIKPGQYIGKVDANSPAEAAGLREGDQIIEVNGVNIGVETHKQVVQRIKAISNEVRLLLIDSNAEGVTPSTKPQKSSVNFKTPTNPKSSNKPSAVESNVPAAVAAVPTADAAEAPSDQKDYITNITMVSTKSQSINRNNSPTVDATDSAGSNKNGHHTKANGQTKESNATATNVEHTELLQQQHLQNSESNPANNKTGLNLNLTAAEMRAKLLAKKKFDPKNESVDLKKKFDIIQKL